MVSALDLLSDDEQTRKNVGVGGGQIEDQGLTFEYSTLSSPYRSLIDAAEAQHGLPKNLLPRLIQEESGFNPKAVSPKGAEGIAQIMRKHHPTVKNPNDPTEAIPYSASYLKQLYNKFGDWSKAVAAYNTGPGNVAAGIIPPETLSYTQKVYGQTPGGNGTGFKSALDLLAQPQIQPVTKPQVVTAQPKIKQMTAPPGGWNESGQPLNSMGVPYPITTFTGQGQSNVAAFTPYMAMTSVSALPKPKVLPKEVAKQSVVSRFSKGLVSLPMTAINTVSDFISWPAPLTGGLATYLYRLAESGDPDYAKNEANMFIQELGKYMPRVPNTDVGRYQEEILTSPLGWPKIAADWMADVSGLRSALPVIPGRAGKVIDYLSDMTSDLLSAFMAFGGLVKGPEALKAGAEFLRDKAIKTDFKETSRQVQQTKGTLPADLERAQAKLEEMAYTRTALEAGEAQLKLSKEMVSKNIADVRAAEKAKIVAEQPPEIKSALDLVKEEPIIPIPEVKPMDLTEENVTKYLKEKGYSEEDASTIAKTDLADRETGMLTFDKEGKREPVKTMEEYDRQFKEFEAEGAEEIPKREEPYTEVDEQIGVPLPENLVYDSSPFRNTDKDATAAMSKAFAEKMDTVRQSPEMLTQYFLNEFNRHLNGEEVNVGKARDSLSELAVRADEARGAFDTDASFMVWRESVSEAAAWARRTDRLKIDRTFDIRDKHNRYRAIADMTQTSGGSSPIPVLEANKNLFTPEEYGRLSEYFQGKGAQDVFEGKARVESVAKEAGISDLVNFNKEEVGIRLNTSIPLDEIPKAVRNIVERIKGIAIRQVPANELYRNKKIFDETGYWLGREGKWRYELDDSKLKLIIVDKGVHNLPSVIDYPKLFETIPGLENTKVDIDSNFRLLGSYNPATDTIGLRLSDRATLVHEVQHTVNFKLGSEFTGSSIGREIVLGQMKEVANRLDDLARFAKTEEIKQLAKDNVSTLRDDINNGRLSNQLVEWFINDLLPEVYKSEGLDLYRRSASWANIDATKNYLSNSGEMEARVSAVRMDMTADERAAKPPWETLDSMLGYEGVTRGYGLEFANVGQKLYSGIPLDEVARAILKKGRSFSDAMRKDEQSRNIGLGESAKNFKKLLIRGAVERSGNIRQAFIDTLGDRGYKIVETMYLQAGAHPKAVNMLRQMRKEVYGGMSKDQKTITNDLTMAMRMIDLGKYKTPKQFTFPEGKTLEQSIIYKELFAHKETNGLRDLSPKEVADTLRRAEAYYEWMKKPVADALEEGLITQKEYNDLISHNYRRIRKVEDVFDRTTEVRLGGKKTTVNDSGIQRIQKGKASDIYEASSEIMALETFNRLYGRIYRNKANKEGLSLARTDPENPFFRIKFKKEELTGRAADLRTRLEAEGKPPEVVTATVNKLLENKIPSDFAVNSVKVYEDGKPINIFLSPEMAKEWITSNSQLTYKYAQFLRWVTGAPLVRTFATGINWAFALRNLPRDVMQIWFTARTFKDGKYESVYNPTAPIAAVQMTSDMLRVFRDTILRRGKYNDYIDDGGGMDLLTTQGRMFTSGKHLESGVDKFYNFAGYPGNTSEIMTRLMVRERVIRQQASERGISYEEAAKDKDIRRKATFAARDYMDFHQGGDIAKALDVGFPYLNARIVAARGMARAMFKDQPVVTAYKLAQFGALVTGLYIGNNALHPETMDALKGDQRTQGNLVFPIGDKFSFEDSKGQTRYPFLVLPIDQGMTFFKTLFEGGTDLFLGNPIDVDRITTTLRSSSPVNLTPIPPTMSGALGYTYNKDFWQNKDIRKQGEIFNYQLPKLLTGKELGGSEEEYTPGKTPEALIGAGAITGLSPERLKYLAGQLVTNDNIFAEILGKGYDTAFGQLPKKEREMVLAETLSNVPIVRSFFKLTNPYSKYAQTIAKSEEMSEVKRFTENRGLDLRTEAFMYDGAPKADVVEYMKSFGDLDTYDRLKKRFEFQIKTKDLDNRSFWMRLEGLNIDARARAYVETFDNASPDELSKLQEQQSQVLKIGGLFTDDFRKEVMRYRQTRD